MGAWSGKELRVTAKQLSNSKQAKLAAARRWGKPELLLPGMIESSDAVSNADALLDDADSHSHSEPELLKTNISQERVSEKRGPDSRHTRFRSILAEYWKAKNHASPEMPWQGRDAKALSDFLSALPQLKRNAVSADAGEPRAIGGCPWGPGVFVDCEFDPLPGRNHGVQQAGVRRGRECKQSGNQS